MERSSKVKKNKNCKKIQEIINISSFEANVSLGVYGDFMGCQKRHKISSENGSFIRRK